MAAATLNTAPYHGYQVLFSPYSPMKLAFTGAQNYGIAGSGVLIVFGEDTNGFKDVARFPWKDGLFDVTWSEINEAVLVVASGDGNVLIFDQSQRQGPVAVLAGHTAEVSTVEWSIGRQEQLVLSASWDSTIRLWDPVALKCISVFTGHSGITYEAVWSPHLPHTFASVSADGSIRVWDSTQAGSTSGVCVSDGRGPVGGGEVLACDWSKYDHHTLVTAGTDSTIKVWDIRRPFCPLLTLNGHTQSVRRVKCDPFHGNIVASCSYDFSVRLWDIGQPQAPLRETILHHSEFTYGLCFNPLLSGKLGDCSWDSTIKLYSPRIINQQHLPSRQ